MKLYTAQIMIAGSLSWASVMARTTEEARRLLTQQYAGCGGRVASCPEVVG
jgi:hypothetical protein